MNERKGQPTLLMSKIAVIMCTEDVNKGPRIDEANEIECQGLQPTLSSVFCNLWQSVLCR